MPGWGKLVAGAIIGAAGTLYATNEELRKQLPETARDLPATVRRRFLAAREAAREASERRRAEILRELETHGGDHAGRRELPSEAPPASSPDGAHASLQPATPDRGASEQQPPLRVAPSEPPTEPVRPTEETRS